MLAVLAAALVAILGFIGLNLFVAWRGGMPAWTASPADVRILTLAFVYFAAFGLASLAVIGIPLTVALSKFRLEGPSSYPIAGFIAGMAVAVLFFTPIGEPYRFDVFLFQLFCGAVPGAFAGAVWWHMFRRQRVFDRGLSDG